MSLIGILFFLVFLFLLAKAIFETIWGICLIFHALFWRGITLGLLALAMILEGINRLRMLRKKAPTRRRRNPVVAGLAYAQSLSE
jgi:hypothetical protein